LLRLYQPTRQFARKLDWLNVVLPVPTISLNRQYHRNDVQKLCDYTLASPTKRSGWLGVRRLVPIDRQRIALGHHEQTEATAANRSRGLAGGLGNFTFKFSLGHGNTP
jgi:hypothetical protein